MKSFFTLLLLLSTFFTACKKEVIEVKSKVIPTTVSVSEKATEVHLEVVSDGIWRINFPLYNYWYDISPLTGSGNGRVTVRIRENRDVIKRHEKIVFSFNSEQVELSLEQGAAGISTGYQAQEVRIHTKARDGKAANLLFLGDGFIQADFSPGGYFDQAVDEAVRGWFGVEPYKSYREYFNIYKMCAVSAERGASHFSRGIERNTALEVHYTGSREGQSDMSVNENTVDEYIKLFSGTSSVRNLDDLEVVIIVNDPRYGGTTTLWSKGPSIALCPINRDTRLPGGFVNILVHEAGGHGFGHLADEYRSNPGTIPADEKAEVEKWQKMGVYQNISVVPDKMHAPWSDFIGVPGYGEVSLFEGGFLYAKGVWRPEMYSCMDDNRAYFNAPSRRSIVQRIKTMAGETFSLAEFIQKDVQKSAPAILYTRGLAADSTRERLAPPVLHFVP